MTSTQKSQGAVNAITPQVGEQLLVRKFGGKELVHCITEAVKNCRDYNGQEIIINIGADYLEVIDNGYGMREENREAFVSTAISTGESEKQTGKFGTGSKHMLYLCKGVEVWSKTPDDIGVVNFKIRTDDYQRLLLNRTPIEVRSLSDSEWKFDYSTGTRLRYDFSGDSQTHIKNLDRIISRLSAELPMVVMDSLLFNGKNLPAKDIKGGKNNLIHEEWVDDRLGMISIELYSLKGKSSNKGVMLSSTGMPEVRFGTFLSMLSEKHRSLIPDLYLNIADLSGVIYCKEMFNAFINEDRNSFQETIADSPLIPHFIMLLRKKEPEVRAMLGMDTERHGTSMEGLMNDLLKRSAKAYGESFSDEPTDKDGDREADSKAIQIVGAQHQYEPKQSVNLKLRVDTNIDDSTLFEWLTAKSGLKSIYFSEDRTELVGTTSNEYGTHTISVQSKNGFTAQTQFEIVASKKPYLSTKHKQMNVGEDIKLVCFNSDMVQGQVKWSISSGPGKLQVLGKEHKQGVAVYFAKASGQATIIAEGMDVNGRPFRDACQITIREKQNRLLKILDFKFLLRQANTAGQAPMFIIKGNGDPHKVEHSLYLNVDSKIWERKEAKGNPMLAIFILASEFARFYFENVLGESISSEASRQRYTQKVDEVMEDFM